MCPKSKKERAQSGFSSDSDEESVSSSSSQLDSISAHASQVDSKEEETTRTNSDIRHPLDESSDSESDSKKICHLEKQIKLLDVEKEAILGFQHRKEREERNSGIFHQFSPSFPGDGNSSSDSGTVPLQCPEMRKIDNSSARQSCEGVPFSVQQDDSNEHISLASERPNSVATTLYNNYKLLLLTLARSLLSSEVVELKNWASEKFSIENAQNANDVLSQLDAKGAVNAEDLSQLRNFFESIIRSDFVHIIDGFLLGDYSLLRDAAEVKSSRHGRISHCEVFLSSTETVRNSATRGNPQNNNEPSCSVSHQTQQAAFSSFSVLPTPSNPGELFSRTHNQNQSTAGVQQDLTSTATGSRFSKGNEMVVVNGSTVLNEGTTLAANMPIRTNQSMTNSGRYTHDHTLGSNGSRHSKLRRPNMVSNPCSPSNSRDVQALNQDVSIEKSCVHYKRHCFVKFECCDQFWPCHRCHNKQSTCGRENLTSRDTHMMKCLDCGKEQQFGEFCCQCSKKFSDYFCGVCKHLTGHDDDPYHCEKCGICRVDKNRSLHCNGCGVCLDVQHYENHHCTSLEVAFTGCQTILCKSMEKFINEYL